MTAPPERSSAEKRAERERLAVVAYQLYDLGFSIIPTHHPWTEIPTWCENPDQWSVGKSAMAKWKPYQAERPAEGQVRSWWGGSALYNIGICTGPVSGFDVVDVDNAAAMAWADDNLDPTPMVTFSGRDVGDGVRGEHRYYRRPEGLDGWLRRQWPAGFELKTTRHCITAPGSRHPSGRLYETAVPWTVDLLAAVPSYHRAALYYKPDPPPPRAPGVLQPDPEHVVVERCRAYVDRIPSAAQGGRHNEAVRVAKLIANDWDLPGDSGLEIFRGWNSANDPPLPDPELVPIFRHATDSCDNARGCKRDQPPPLRFVAAAGRAAEPPPHGDEDAPQGVGSMTPAGSALPKVVTHPRSTFTIMSRLESRAVDFLMAPYFPIGEVTLVSSPGGRGKSTFLAALAAAVTNGSSICGVPVRGGRVFYQSGEDDPQSVLRPRFEHNGADLDEVGAFRCDLVENEGDMVLDHRGLALLASNVSEMGPELRLVVLDPIVNFLAGGFNMNDNAAVTRLLSPLARLAKKLRCAVVVVAHHNGKDDISGAKAFWNRSKSVLTIYDHPADPMIKVAAHRKSNFGLPGSSLAFRTESVSYLAAGGVPGTVPRVIWNGLSPLTAEQLTATASMSPIDRMAMAEAMRFLEGFLANGRRPMEDVTVAYRAARIESSAFKAARFTMRCRVTTDIGPDGSSIQFLGLY